MSFSDWLLNWFSGSSSHHDELQHNPATGLPMTGGIDILGNPWGSDLVAERRDEEFSETHARHREAAEWHHHDDWHRTSWDDWHDHHRWDDNW